MEQLCHERTNLTECHNEPEGHGRATPEKTFIETFTGRDSNMRSFFGLALVDKGMGSRQDVVR